MSDLRVFKRYEKKYMLTKEQFEGFFNELRDELLPDEYPENLIQNIYYDTPNFRLIRESIEKPVYKEKLRLRCYNTIKAGEDAYLEIKKKYEGIVYKRREKMNLSVMEDFMSGRSGAATQIGRELEWFVKYYKELYPAMYLSYYRTAWVLKKDTSLRITFDTDITWRTKDVDLTKGSYGEKLLDEGTVLMEVKCGEALPPEMIRLFEKYNIYPTSCSKYGMAYQKHIEEKSRQAAAGLERRVASYHRTGAKRAIA